MGPSSAHKTIFFLLIDKLHIYRSSHYQVQVELVYNLYFVRSSIIGCSHFAKIGNLAHENLWNFNNGIGQERMNFLRKSL